MVNPLERIKEERGLSTKELCFEMGLNYSNFRHCMAGTYATMPKSYKEPLENLGYDPDEIQREYIEWNISRLQDKLKGLA